MAQRALVVTFIGDTSQLDSAVKRSLAQYNGFANSVARSGASWSTAGRNMQTFGRQMAPVSAGLAAIGGYAIKSAVDFQSSTEKFRTQAGATQAQVEQLRKGILNMAGAVGQTPTQLSAGMYHVVSSMNAVLPPTTRAQQELTILKVAAEGAQIGGSNLEETSYALASAMNALHQNAGQAQTTMGQLNAIVGAGDMTMSDLLDAMKSGLIPTAASFGVSLQSVGSALAVMGDMGMRGALAGTRLRMALALLGAPTAKAAGLLHTIGVSAGQASADTAKMSDLLAKAGLSTTQLAADLKRPDGLAVALQDVNTHLERSGVTASGAAALISDAFGGGRMGAAIKLLDENTGRLQLKFAQIGKTGSQFQSDWAATTQTASFKWHQMIATLDTDAIKLGTTLLPIAENIAGDIEHMVNAFTDLPSPVKKAVEVLAALAVVLAPIALVTGTIARGVGGLTTLFSKIGGKAPGAAAPIVAGGTSTSAIGAATADAASATLVSKLRMGVATALSRGVQGVAIAGFGALLAQAVGGAIHGSVGSAVKSIGSDAAIGAGIGSIFGMPIPGAVVGGLVGAISTFIHNDAQKQGDEFAKQFTSTFAGQMTASVQEAQKNLASAGTKAIPHLAAPGTNLGAMMNSQPRFELNAGQKLTPQASQYVDTAELAKVVAAAGSWGKAAGSAFATGWKQVKVPTTTVFLSDAKTALNDVPAQVKKAGSAAVAAWRSSAAQQMIAYATSLQQNGKLPMKGLQQIVRSLEAQVPGLSNYLVQEGGVKTARGLADAYRFTQASANLRSALSSYRQQFGDWQVQSNITGQNIWHNAATAMTHLRQVLKTGSQQAKQDALANITALQQQSKTLLGRMATDAADKMAEAASGIATNSRSARDQATGAFNQLVANIGAAMKAGLENTNTGMQLIAKALNEQLKAFGAKPLPTPSAIAWANWATTGAANTSSGGIGHRATGGTLVDKPVFMVGEEAPTHPEIVIASNPAYRTRNLGLWAHAGKMLGVPGYATGGVVTASMFGGPTDSTVSQTDPRGYRGDNLLQHPDSYAELNMGTALGGLPYLAPLNVTYSGKTARLFKRDIGAGGPGLNGHVRAIDLWFQAAQSLGMPGLADVLVNGGGGVNVNIAGGSAGGAAAAATQFGVPQVKGGGTIGTILQAGYKKIADAANAYIAKVTPTVTVGGGGVSGPTTTAPPAGSTPSSVDAKMTAAANSIQGLPYSWGGGHGGFVGTPGFDCSGAVSFILHAGGFTGTPMDTVALGSWGQPGPGKFITVGDIPASGQSGHTMMSFFGKFFESGGPSGQGPHWDQGWSQSFPTYRHPQGYRIGGLVGDFGQMPPSELLRQTPWLAGTREFENYTTTPQPKVLPFAGNFAGGGVVGGQTGQPAVAIVHGGEIIGGGSNTGTHSLSSAISAVTATSTISGLAQLEREFTKAGATIKRLTSELAHLTSGPAAVSKLTKQLADLRVSEAKALQNAPKSQQAGIRAQYTTQRAILEREKTLAELGTKATKQRLETELKSAKTDYAKFQKQLNALFAPYAVIPSQSVTGQIKMTGLQNQVQAAQNVGDVPGQQSGLNAELKLEQQWLQEDQAKLKKINKALAVRGLSKKQRAGLLQDKLALLQEIGTITGDIGSTQTSLTDLATASATGSSADQSASDLANALSSLQQAADTLNQTLTDQTAYMKQVGDIETRTAIKALADVISGQIGGNYLSRSTGSAGVGTVVRY